MIISNPDDFHNYRRAQIAQKPSLILRKRFVSALSPEAQSSCGVQRDIYDPQGAVIAAGHEYACCAGCTNTRPVISFAAIAKFLLDRIYRIIRIMKVQKNLHTAKIL